MGKDNSLKKEFEEKFEERKHTDQPLPTPDATRDDAAYRDDVRTHDNDRYRNETAKTIPVIEEQVHVGSKVVETGKVLISKSVYDEEVTIDLPTVEEEVEVERVPVNEYVETMPPPVRYEGEYTIIPVLKEVAVVEKRILLVEEIHIRKRHNRTHESQPIRLRKEEIDIKRSNPDHPKGV